jgi:hypothetical protein
MGEASVGVRRLGPEVSSSTDSGSFYIVDIGIDGMVYAMIYFGTAENTGMSRTSTG